MEQKKFSEIENITHAFFGLTAVDSSNGKIDLPQKEYLRKVLSQYIWIINQTAGNPRALLLISFSSTACKHREVRAAKKQLLDYAVWRLGKRVIEIHGDPATKKEMENISKLLDKSKSIKIMSAGEVLNVCVRGDGETLEAVLRKHGFETRFVATRLAGLHSRHYNQIGTGKRTDPSYYANFRKSRIL